MKKKKKRNEKLLDRITAIVFFVLSFAMFVLIFLESFLNMFDSKLLMAIGMGLVVIFWIWGWLIERGTK